MGRAGEEGVAGGEIPELRWPIWNSCKGCDKPCLPVLVLQLMGFLQFAGSFIIIIFRAFRARGYH